MAARTAGCRGHGGHGGQEGQQPETWRQLLRQTRYFLSLSSGGAAGAPQLWGRLRALPARSARSVGPADTDVPERRETLPPPRVRGRRGAGQTASDAAQLSNIR